jgi:hypothetical protein
LNGYQAELDGFKLSLGIPPDICVRAKDPLLEEVSLIDPAFRPIQDRVGVLQQNVGDLILELLPDGGAQLTWSQTAVESLAQLREALDEVDRICGQIMEGDDAQIVRVQEDGLKLGRRLRTALEEQLSTLSAEADRNLAAKRQADLDLLDRVMREINEASDWLDRLHGFNLLRDSLADIDRIQAELQAGGVIDLEWMRTDANPTTVQMFRQYRDAILSLNQLPEDQQAAVAATLRNEILQQRLPLAERLEQIVVDNPWLAELDRWRTAADDVDAAIADSSAAQIRRLQHLFAQFVDTMIDVPGRLNALPGKIRDYQQRIDALIDEGAGLSSAELSSRFRTDISPAIPQELVNLSEYVLTLSLMQARDRAETVSLIEVDLHPAMALEIARANRRDWMNARASLVDNWRAIEFIADDLESRLDVIFEGDIRNRGDNPFRLDSDTGQLRVGLAFDAPLTRLNERNAYREALIGYQQARRNYYRVEDNVSRSLRATLRALQLSRRNFEIRREAVRNADLQIQLNEDIRKLQEASRQPSGPTAARDAVSALADLLTAQNDFLSVWVTYDLLRRTLDFDLGTMELDIDGIWIDPGSLGPEQGLPGVEVDLEDECWPGPLNLVGGLPCPLDPCMDAQPLQESFQEDVQASEFTPETVPLAPPAVLPVPGGEPAVVE